MKNFKILLLVLMLTTGVQNMNAQEDFDDDTQDVPQAPINDYIIPMLLAGVYLGYRLLKSRTKEA
ncbi:MULTISPECIES: hypothetical protein [Flavobacterium]|jgi:hypothetical protein|uniref:Secreted protein with PEP-CTERM sorting signal n=1 Tax=Flavobacterium lindanitolerans TaxID=428988 RepID=A0A497UZQ9_9FLAO|nr:MULTISPECIES: hypothetical protein [Flavobacterium]PZO29723.1 MAG: hypothetical protein DCE86_10595 [Flavobacteriaceae bacterium]PZQ83327.1 MAG: hypothetical protein DI548_10975 [Flavobacterium johnsoniae]KQS53180.1 hypothetical protein ASG38_00060 [Flavobacterium sp. Leaf359]MBL7867489.1 hypothetical protein [Flavobacterium lindanitolerans]PKW21199.1 hypothetical protein B0G92_2483 [Flavobacterium lindanitolerans]